MKKNNPMRNGDFYPSTFTEGHRRRIAELEQRVEALEGLLIQALFALTQPVGAMARYGEYGPTTVAFQELANEANRLIDQHRGTEVQS